MLVLVEALYLVVAVVEETTVVLVVCLFNFVVDFLESLETFDFDRMDLS